MRSDQSKPSSGNNDIIDAYLYPLMVPLVKRFVPPWVTPNAITTVAFVFCLLAAGSLFFISQPIALVLSGSFILLWNIVDSCDGIQARLTNQKSKFGAFFDPYVDIVGEFFIFMGILYYFDVRNYWYISALMGRFAYKTALAFYMISLTQHFVTLIGQSTANCVLAFILLWQYFFPFQIVVGGIEISPLTLYFIVTLITLPLLFVQLLMMSYDELK